MAKGDICKIIIKDDFNNVLILQKKTKKDEISKWVLVSSELKGRESDEKAANRAVKDDLKIIVFDLEKIKEEEINEKLLMVYTGSIRERVICADSIKKIQWVNKRELGKYEMEEVDKNILNEFFSSK
ncbi:hypothetical protein [Clostridium sp.]|uniref:hypothetical protein n=1 Tax=Clostridium sp. TaxID=1506 RepID=UPI003992ED9B